jgi:glucose-6-phosphate 1-dehydrogenase
MPQESGAPGASPAPPSVFVIFGGGGDLTKRKLIPALYNLASRGLLPENFAVVGVDRSARSAESYRDYLEEEVPGFIGDHLDRELWESFKQRVYSAELDFRDADAYQRLAESLATIDQDQGTPGNYLFYLATPPSFFGEIARQLRDAGLAKQEDGRWRRLIIEKPFGHDLDSARELNASLHECFDEPQIFRIDHYMGKETVQNILAYRFANSTVEPIWNHRYVDHIQITVAESVGVENRASYYEEAGALRDMVPNHLLAVLALVAMEPANSMDPEALRDEQTKVLRSIQELTPEEVLTRTVRGQYGPGVVDDKPIPGYRQEPRIDPESRTETYVAMRLMIDSWRWVGVPFYLRTGKRMPGRFTEVAVYFKHAPNAMFRDARLSSANLAPNMLVLRMAPAEGIDMAINAKVPGPEFEVRPVVMDFHYKDYFGSAPTTGYETLIYDCMNGDATLFKRADNIEAGWEIMQPILDVWGALPTRDFPNYAAGSWGPKAAEKLLQGDGHTWKPCDCLLSKPAGSDKG